MKLRHYSFAITLIVTTLFSSCKQNLRMQGNYEEEKPTINNDNSNNTKLLFKAVKISNKERVKELLLNNVDINTKDKNGWTSLYWAAEKGNIEVVKSLIEGGAEVNAKGIYGKTTLHWAAEYGKTEIAELLIKGGADVNAKDEDGDTPLHWAAEYGKTEIAELLIKRGAEVNVTNNYAGTPLHIAAWEGHKEVAELLINRGADLEAKDQYGDTPLHIAAEDGNLGFFYLIKDIILGKNEEYNMVNKVNRLYCSNYLLEQKSIVSNIPYEKNLIREIAKFSDLNVDLSIKNEFHKTPLDISREKGHTAIIEILEELEKSLN